MKILEFLIGLPASGKSTYANIKRNQNNDIVVFSSDEIRKEFGINSYTKEDNDKVFNLLHERLFDELKKETHHVIYDATNLSKKRFGILEEIRKHFPETEIHYVFFAITIETCIKRDLKREASVGKDVILRLLKGYTGFYEDLARNLFDEIIVIRENIEPLSLKYLLIGRNFKQENYHHTQTLSKHIQQVREQVNGEILKKAATWHDFGKIYTKTKDSKQQAHYYNHNNVSSYLYAISMFPTVINKINLVPSRVYKISDFYVQAIIELHMDNNLNSRKINRLYIAFRNYGFDLKKDLQDFQKADKYRTLLQKLIIKKNLFLHKRRKN